MSKAMEQVMSQPLSDDSDTEKPTESDEQRSKPDEATNSCALIYGSLPPDIKKSQATLFNERADGVKYLLATDAIGMGLNLNIKRVIFLTMRKFTQQGPTTLKQSEVKQIAGRAGRYKENGKVTTFKPRDLERLDQYLHPRPLSEQRYEKNRSHIRDESLFDTEIKKACIFPPFHLVE